LFAVGCGGNRTIYPVSGKIVDLDGEPIPGLAGHTVEFDALDAASSATGPVQEDGSFRMTTTRAGDGAWLGKHRVLISRPGADTDAPPARVIPAKYEEFDTSDLTVEVKPESNHVILRVQKLKARGD
jgi:hypothetical protein